ncbi:hypothetical protein A2165_02450 [Candidatus Curtissbacteria bacterium RBG_13_40_7]|uniref:Uncharacterized protein n=1 Tax=Candidatus Curtissbacteria bacterium RBG_13_40_7 TaxID=1797706 RepID=A0A1F5FYI0_9BACT|nr:MAG: hypothetical protein A2165_02450 [Candidatus Curtissbacteria bacterium RBG_13_40_7]
MAERKIGLYILKKRRSRRQLFTDIGITAAGAVLAVPPILREGIILNDENFGYIEQINKKTKQQLLQYNPITIAHRGGNKKTKLKLSQTADVDFVEADLSTKGDLLTVGHEQYWGSFTYDRQRKLLRLGGPDFLFDDLLTIADSQNQNLFLDLKTSSKHAVDKLEQIIASKLFEHKVLFCGNWQGLDALSKSLGRNDNLFGSR